MTSIDDIPPAYFDEANLPPPSYDVAAAKAAVEAVPANKLEEFKRGVAQALSNSQVEPHILTAARNAVEATSAIEGVFSRLTARLLKIDRMKLNGDEEPFEPQLAAIKLDYRRVIVDSQHLAIEIASYGERFEDVIIPYCSSDEYTASQKMSKINIFIETADRFSASAEKMASRFSGLKTRFSTLVGKFENWAQDRVEADEGEIKRLKDDIVELEATLANIETALETLTGTLGLTLGILGVVEVMSGPAAPVIVTIGAIIAGIQMAAMVGLIIAKRTTNADLTAKRSRVNTLEDEVNAIANAKDELIKAGKEELLTFSDHISVLSLVWRSAHDDANEVKYWLERGAKDTDRPKYLGDAVGNAVSVYRTMARYLRAYANGVKPID